MDNVKEKTFHGDINTPYLVASGKKYNHSNGNENSITTILHQSVWGAINTARFQLG
jgi:hypothetical protein